MWKIYTREWCKNRALSQSALLAPSERSTGTLRALYWYPQSALLVPSERSTGPLRVLYWYPQSTLLVPSELVYKCSTHFSALIASVIAVCLHLSIAIALGNHSLYK